MKRRRFIGTMGAAAALPFIPGGMFDRRGAVFSSGDNDTIPLGGPLFEPYENPGQWVGQLRQLGYGAAYCPLDPGADEQLIRAYRQAARLNNIVIAEVGAWSNLLSGDPEEAEAAIDKCVAGLELADLIGARCCVNISGSLNRENWAGPHPENLSEETFGRVVENTRRIIDAVKPRQSFFALEAMPWSFPDSPDSYLRLIRAIDREQFGVHLDPVNMITSVRNYFSNGALIREMFTKLGPWIRSCHAKDITLRQDNYIPQLDELRPGLGNLDYVTYLKELAKLGGVPLMMEHLDIAVAYGEAVSYIRSIAISAGVRVSEVGRNSEK
ncbi:MAG: sugar phosphate isomerase/epimerase family protein [Bacteroidales bacterium]